MTILKTAGVLAFAVACFTSASATAQVVKTKVSGGAILSTTEPKASIVTPDAQPKTEEALPAGATVIYSNFGTGSSVYDAATGWTEAGEEANDYPLAEAMSFTPDTSYVLLRIDAGLTWVTGTNGVKLELAEDNAGVPGPVIFTASFTNLPVFGTCCTVQTVTLAPTKTDYIELKGGKTYWLYPLPADTTSYLVWNLDTTNMSGNGAVSETYGHTWTAASLSPFGAFDVYGMKQSH
jgi:hypothetical protein